MAGKRISQKPETESKDTKGLDTLISYRATFNTEAGQKVLSDLIKRYMMRPSMSVRDADTFFMEGERNVVLMILKALEIDEKTIQERVKRYATKI